MLLSNNNSNNSSSSSEYRTNMEMKNAKETSMAALKCPRCNSSNTKFCYYNNYSLSQPRHFCKACKRYWTRGGTLRNVPIGGGCRKNKRAKKPHPHPSSSSSSSAVLPCRPPPPPSSLPMLSSTNMDFNPFAANLPPIPTSFLQQQQVLDGFNTLGYPSSAATTNHDQQFFDPLLGSSLSSAAAASLLLSSIKQQPVMVSCDNMQNCSEDGSLGLALLKQVKMEADHHHHLHHAWVQAPCGINPFESSMPANTVVDSPSTNLFWSWNQSLGPWPDTHATNCGSSVAPLI